MPPSPGPDSFSFQAQSDDGQRLTGVIDAPDADAVLERLQALRMRVVDVKRVSGTNGHGTENGRGNGDGADSATGTDTGAGSSAARGTLRASALRGEDFAAFNQQLAQLTKAGLPV